MTGPIDDAFLRFQATGAPEAIAVVFDLAAPELLRVASHLTHDLHAAEDLVQATFVVAIERRADYTPDEGVLPWLLGILTNRARRLRRDDARSPDPERLVSPSTRSPQDHAVEIELNESVDAALSGLPEVYRLVLRLHLRNHMSAREIALALERPPGTVRTQIVRGLELLRRALPVGISGWAGSARAPGMGLVAMRARVIEHALRSVPVKAGVGGFAAIAVTGAMLMKKVVVGFALAIVALTLGWMVASRDSRPEAWRPESSEVQPRVVAIEGGEKRIAPGQIQRLAVSGVPTAGTGLTKPRAAHVHGRVVDEAGLPLANATVTLTRLFRSREDRERVESLAELPKPTATSAEDGRFDVALDPADFACEVQIELEGFATLQRITRELGPGDDLDCGDAELAVTCQVAGIVMDPEGVPLADAMVEIRWKDYTGLGQGRFLPAGSPWWNKTDARGHFVVVKPLSKGVHTVGVHPSGTDQWTHAEDLVIAPGQRHAELRLTCRAADAGRQILGRVVDGRGVPVAEAQIRCSAPGGLCSMPAFVGRDGSFRLDGGTGMPSTGLSLFGDACGFRPFRTPPEHRLETTDVVLVLHALPSIDLTVVHRDDGAPVEDFGVRLFGDPYWFGDVSGHGNIEHRGTHSGGRLAVTANRAGRNLLVVEPTDTQLARPRMMVVEVTDVDVQVRVEVPVSVRRTLRVVGADGTPVAGTRIELVEPTHEFPVQREAPVLAIDGFDRMTRQYLGQYPLEKREQRLRRSEGLLVQSGTTDSRGEIVLTAGARDDFGLHLRGPGHVPSFISGFALGETDPICVKVDSGGSIEVKVAPVDVVRALEARLRFVSVSAPTIAFPEVERSDSGGGLRFDTEGKVRVDGMAAGSWNVHLIFRTGSAQRADLIGTVGDLRTGAPRSLEVAVDHLRPGRLHGRLQIDDEFRPQVSLRFRSTPPVGQAPVYINGQETMGEGSGETCETDADGGFDIALTPGTYRVSVEPNELVKIGVPREITIAPGATVTENLFVRRVRLVVRVLDAANGAPAANRSIGIQPAIDFQVGVRWQKTDAAGELVLDPAPLAPFELRTMPTSLSSTTQMDLFRRGGPEALRRAMIQLGRFQVRDGEKEQVIEVRLTDR